MALSTIGTNSIADDAVTSTKTTVGGIIEADLWRLTTSFTGGAAPIASNWERSDDASFSKIGTGMSQSSGVFTFPSTGIQSSFCNYTT